MTLLASGLASPTEARAGCGHLYVVSGAEVSVGDGQLELIVGFGATSRPEGDLPKVPLRRCSGPSCSKAPLLPVVPASLTPLRIEQWGCLTVATPRRDSSGIAAPTDEGLVHFLVLSSSVFHPPRLSR